MLLPWVNHLSSSCLSFHVCKPRLITCVYKTVWSTENMQDIMIGVYRMKRGGKEFFYLVLSEGSYNILFVLRFTLVSFKWSWENFHQHKLPDESRLPDFSFHMAETVIFVTHAYLLVQRYWFQHLSLRYHLCRRNVGCYWITV